ncbi:MAG: hypothetical protein JST54_15185 [Deltaproteobacteria bacterium]|nr:hypothetical protein [Deltaproteobacteria bacterium]
MPAGTVQVPADFDFQLEESGGWKKVAVPGRVFNFFRCPEPSGDEDCRLTAIGPVLMNHDDLVAKLVPAPGGDDDVKPEGPFRVRTSTPFRVSMFKESHTVAGSASFTQGYVVDVNGLQMVIEMTGSTPESLEAQLPVLKGTLKTVLEHASGKPLAQAAK